MTSDEADQRIILSRTTLHRYRQMVDCAHWPVDDLPLFEREIAILESIAMDHPGLVEDLLPLVEGWSALRTRIWNRLN